MLSSPVFDGVKVCFKEQQEVVFSAKITKLSHAYVRHSKTDHYYFIYLFILFLSQFLSYWQQNSFKVHL